MTSHRLAAARTAAVAIVLLGLFACHDITAPRPSSSPATRAAVLINSPGLSIVTPDSMRTWAFYDDQHGVLCSDAASCRIVPAGANRSAGGGGSAELATSSTTVGNAIVLQDYAGTRLDQITDLRYSTFRQTEDAGSNLAIALQLTVDYDLTDQSLQYQGRLVFEPYQGVGGNVPIATWQRWDAKAGKWWGTKSSVRRNSVVVSNSCVQATPCSWPQLLAAFPNLGVHSTYGAVVLKAGSGWANFRGNVDSLTIAIDGISTTFDFEPSTPSAPIHLRAQTGAGIVGTRLSADSQYTAGATVAYDFAAAPGFETPYVVLDDTLASLTGSIVMDRSHSLEVVADTAYSVANLSGDGSHIAQSIAALLHSGDKAQTYADLMLYFAERLEAGADPTTLARDNELAWYLTVDPSRDAAALAAMDAALNGTVFSIRSSWTRPLYVTYIPPTLPGAASRMPVAAPSASKGRSGGAQLRPPQGPRRAVVPVESLDDPQEPTAIVYVNGIGTDEGKPGERTGASLTTSLLNDLLDLQPRFANNSSIEVTHIYNRRAEVQLAEYDATHPCVMDSQRGMFLRIPLITAIRYAGCKGARFVNRVTTTDIVEAITARLQLLLQLSPTNPDVEKIANYVNVQRTLSENPKHVIFVGHSEGTLLIAQAMRTLPALEHHPIQDAKACVAVLALASAADRYSFDVDGPYKLGFRVEGDIIRNTVVTGWDELPTPSSARAAQVIAAAMQKDTAKGVWEYFAQGVVLHGIERTYLSDETSRAAIVSQLTTLHKECLQGELRLPADTLIVAVEGEITLPAPTVWNQNQRELKGRIRDRYFPDAFVVLDTNRLFARTPHENPWGIAYSTNILTEYTYVTIPLASIIGSEVTEQYSSYWELIAATNAGLGDPPYGYEQGPTYAWSGAGETCPDTVTIYGRAGPAGLTSGTFAMHCQRSYRVTLGTASPASVAAQVVRYGATFVPVSGFGIRLHPGDSLRASCVGAEKCLAYAVVDGFDRYRQRLATSGPKTMGGDARLSAVPGASPTAFRGSVSRERTGVVLSTSATARRLRHARNVVAR